MAPLAFDRLHFLGMGIVVDVGMALGAKKSCMTRGVQIFIFVFMASDTGPGGLCKGHGSIAKRDDDDQHDADKRVPHKAPLIAHLHI
jgi:hypothetical protein